MLKFALTFAIFFIGASEALGADIASGGLGLPRASWEALHGEPDPESGSSYYLYAKKKYFITFISGHIQHLEIRLGKNAGASLSTLRAMAAQFIPRDASLVQNSRQQDGWWVDVYHSEALATLNSLMRVEGLDFWFGSPPGTFTVMFHAEYGRVVMATGGHD